MKKFLRKQEGVTLVILMITIVVMIILTSIAVKNVDIGDDVKKYNYMCADIELLESKIISYYNDNGTLPTTGSTFNAKIEPYGLDGQESSRDNNNYYQIDISKLNYVTLNYGDGTIADKNIYVVNEQSLEVYYLKGVEYEETVYYTQK